MDINTISNLLSSFREDFFLISANQNTLLSTWLNWDRRDRIWQLDLQIPMQSVPITTDVVNLNPAQATRYNIM